jgi:RNA polymerase sigma-54 factor
MTQQLQQSIKLLQATALELQAFVDLELEKNPFLSQEDEESDSPADAQPEASTEETAPREADFGGDENFSSEMPESRDSDDSHEIETDYLNSSHSTSSRAAGDFDDDERTIDDNPSQGMTLREHLLSQLQVDIQGPVQRMIGAHLIDLVDDAGYIKDDLKAVAETLGSEVSEVEAVLVLLQRFDPAGICARNLSECLSLQLKDKNRLDPAMQSLLAHLHLLGDGKFTDLQKKCGVDQEDLKQMIAEIRELNPKPGAGFNHDVVQAVEPDIFVRRLPDGNWHVELNMNNFPKVMVNQRYYKKVTATTKNQQDKQYLAERFGTANWLVRALKQRADTMLKVGSELVKQQDAFFRLGVRYLKPMTLKDIAAATGYHESTISRVTSGKFIICPRGTFELKYFFTSALARAEGRGDDISSAAVKNHIQEMVEKETVGHILSDDELAAMLKERNITVARRTVAKYREALHIPSSPKRKRLKLQKI